MRSDKTPSELLREAGYILYDVRGRRYESLKNIMPWRRTLFFWLNRLESSLFLCVKENVDDIKREDFKNLKGKIIWNKCISISLLKMMLTLSIKNRYNHSVNDPDATFSNNLDNIIPGLTDSFARILWFGTKNF